MTTGPEADFEAIVGELDYPMIVVTAAAGGQRGGCLVGFATQCSVSPPRYAVYVSEKNRTFKIAGEAQTLGVHFLAADDEDLARLFGGETGDEVDKLAQVEWQEGPDGVPLLDRCPNRFVGRILDRHPAGDHVGFVLEPVHVDKRPPFEPFYFQRAKRIDSGHDA